MSASFCQQIPLEICRQHPKERAPAWLREELTYLQHVFGLSEVELVDLLLDEVERRELPVVAWWGRLLHDIR